MLQEKLKNHNVILASKSPRRQELLKTLNIDFEIKTKEIDEVYPDHLIREEIPVYLSQLKSKAFEQDIRKNDLIITSDTIVWHNNTKLGKPKNYDEAFNTLNNISNDTHEVITAVTLKTKDKVISFYDVTTVYFNHLKNEEIDFYIKTYNPYDKAGSYGIQEWIGAIGINKIEGSYFNVVGLPLEKLYTNLSIF